MNDQRKLMSTIPLRGTSPLTIKALRDRIKVVSGCRTKLPGGRAFVYRTSDRAREITIANHDVEGRRDLVAVYDRHVTTAMLRQDLYGEDPADIRFAEWGERKVA